MAIHKDLHGQGIGTDLILHALHQAARASQTVASYAVILDAKNEKVAALYARLGFIPFRLKGRGLPSTGRRRWPGCGPTV